MIEIILLVIGIIKAVRRPRLRRLRASEFPGVDPEKFEEWQNPNAQLQATDIFLWATWGAFFVKLLFVSGTYHQTSEFIIGIVILIGWIIGLIIASVFSRKAKRLGLAASINWPKKN